MKALVTGASSGIGLSIAKYLYSLGYEVILVGLDKEKLSKVAKEVNSNKYYDLDLTKEENIYKLYDKVKDEDIDVLINNAGFGLFGLFN